MININVITNAGFVDKPRAYELEKIMNCNIATFIKRFSHYNFFDNNRYLSEWAKFVKNEMTYYFGERK